MNAVASSSQIGKQRQFLKRNILKKQLHKPTNPMGLLRYNKQFLLGLMDLPKDTEEKH